MRVLKAGLIGEPVAHSLSRVMHNAAFAVLKIDADYELWDTPLDGLPDRVHRLRQPGILGANVTVPHKQSVMPLLDSFAPAAERVGAVNTIIPRDGRLIGDNTDAYGFARSLSEVMGDRSIGRAVVVGAGGASRAVLVALQDAGVPDILLVNRTRQRADDLAADLARETLPSIQVAESGDVADVARGADVLVNATSVGWHGNELPVPEEVLHDLSPEAVVVDLTYRDTAMLQLARDLGRFTLDGLPMLIHQGARSFELWTGHDAPVAAMESAVIAEQRRRATAG